MLFCEHELSYEFELMRSFVLEMGGGCLRKCLLFVFLNENLHRCDAQLELLFFMNYLSLIGTMVVLNN